MLAEVTAQLEDLKLAESRARVIISYDAGCWLRLTCLQNCFSQLEEAMSCAICTRVFREPYVYVLSMGSRMYLSPSIFYVGCNAATLFVKYA